MSEFYYDKTELQALAFTMKKLGDGEVDREYYQDVMYGWCSKNKSLIPSAMEFELDSTGKLHAHGIIVVNKNFLKKKLQTQGCYIYVTDCYDIDRWRMYITKEQNNEVVDNSRYMF